MYFAPFPRCACLPSGTPLLSVQADTVAFFSDATAPISIFGVQLFDSDLNSLTPEIEGVVQRDAGAIEGHLSVTVTAGVPQQTAS